MVDFIDDYEAPSEEPISNFDPLPAGDYVAQIIESDVTDTRSGSGRILKLTWAIAEGPHEHRQFWQNINYRNQNAKAQEIGKRQLDEVVWSTGITHLSNTEEMHFIPCLVRLKVRPADGDFPAQTEVVTVKRLSTAPAPQRQPAARPQQAQQTRPAQQQRAAGGNRPWPQR